MEPGPFGPGSLHSARLDDDDSHTKIENSPRSLDKPPLRELPPSRWNRSRLGTRAAACAVSRC